MVYRICPICFGEAKKNHRYCAECNAKCVRCRAKPKTKNQQYCRACASDRRDFVRMLAWESDARKRAGFHAIINKHIRQGKLVREDCRVPGCGKGPGLVYAYDLENRRFTFLCLKHSDEANDRYGRMSEEKHAKIQSDLREAIALGKLDSFHWDREKFRPYRAGGRLEDAYRPVDARPSTRPDGRGDHSRLVGNAQAPAGGGRAVRGEPSSKAGSEEAA